MGNPFRVFISYSHRDQDLAREIINALLALHLTPMYDQNFAVGLSFDEQIKTFIAHALVFLPILTENSINRGWVHQEIGYALALNVPVLPVTVGSWPGQMLQTLHAVQLSEDPGERKHEIEHMLKKEVFEDLVNRYRGQDFARYESAEFTEDRAIMLARFANEVLHLREHGIVRQMGGLSSFHIPNNVISHPIWKARYGTHQMTPFHCRCLREERYALEQHALVAGCRLMIDPSLSYEKYGIVARIVRLQTLVNSLKQMKNEEVCVAFNERMDKEGSVTIVGNWFAAESVSSSIGHGYRQTIFTRHAPSMQYRIDLFDQEFQECLKERGWKAVSSKAQAMEDLNTLISNLENGLEAEEKIRVKEAVQNSH